MRLLVTGGMGFIGSNFIRQILEKYPSYSVVNLDKITYGNPETLRDFSSHPKYRFVKGDICDKDAVDSAIKDVDAVVHFAAESHVENSIYDPYVFTQTNVLGTHTLLESARQNGVKKFVHISTDEVYGNVHKGSVTETDRLHPTNPYSCSKAAAEFIARAYFLTYKLPLVITRSSNNFGPFQHPEKMMPRFLTRLIDREKVTVHGTGMNIRDWLYVKDNCEAVDVILHQGEIGEVYNIAGENEMTNLDITKRLLREMEKDESHIMFVEDRLNNDWRYSLDCTKLKKIGWQRKGRFEDNLRETVKWYKENAWWWRELKSPVANRYGHCGYEMVKRTCSAQSTKPF